MPKAILELLRSQGDRRCLTLIEYCSDTQHHLRDLIEVYAIRDSSEGIRIHVFALGQGVADVIYLEEILKADATDTAYEPRWPIEI
jgi:hypothetical protein